VTELGAGSVIGFDADYLLNDLSRRGAEELAAASEDGLEILDGLEMEVLTPEEQLAADVLRWYLEDQVAMAGYIDFDNPVNFITGAHSNFPEFMADVHPITTEQDAEHYVERLNAYLAVTRRITPWCATCGTGLPLCPMRSGPGQPESELGLRPSWTISSFRPSRSSMRRCGASTVAPMPKPG